MKRNDLPDPARRRLLAGSAGVAGFGLLGAAPVVAAHNVTHWDAETDVLVVGTGAAGAAAAIFARQADAAVLMIEKADYFGGTTAKSQGGYWIPNNHLMRARGLTDERAAALRYMARLSYPELYNAADTQLGLAPDDYALIATFYDHAWRVVERLEALDVLRSTFFPGAAGYEYMPDYYAALAQNEAPLGRILSPRRPDGTPGMGDEIARQFEVAVEARGIEVRFQQRAVRLVQDASGAVVGVEVADADQKTHHLRARRGVVFGTGGFIHNAPLRRRFLRGPVYGGCTVPAAQGDFIALAQAAGAQLGNMQHAWWAELVFEQAVVNSAVPMNVFVPPGDAMLQVDRTGRRYVNEKFVYNERAQLHFVWDPQRAEYRNLLTFMVYDRRVAEQFAGMFPLPPGPAPYVIEGADFQALGAAIGKRLTQLAPHTGGFALDDDFAGQLAHTVSRFNGFATSGKDADFQRGETPVEGYFHNMYRPPDQTNPSPNPTMHPLADQGPYYAIILCAGVLDTKGGPRIDTHARVLDAFGAPIPGLYGAGNCIASPAAQAYWSAGGTIGPALTFGALAGEHAAARR